MSKKSDIKKIKSILEEWGGTSVGELQADNSPIVFSVGNVNVLAESFNVDNVEVVVYDGEHEIERDYKNYEELDEFCISQIKDLLEDYDADMYKTEKRISD
jgi:hypothetical protein